MKEKKRRLLSPSSINCYKQCPRKYYYAYILNISAPPNIHQVRGNIAHSVLENFFDQDIKEISFEKAETKLKSIIQKLLMKEWNNYKEKLNLIGLNKEKEMFYFEETLMMLFNWTEQFINKINQIEGEFEERFKKLTPIREQLYESENYGVKGFIDAIENREGNIYLMDYKTSSKFEIDSHLLQLGIYSLLYFEKHGVLPKKVGIYFLKEKEKHKKVDSLLLETAKKEIIEVAEKTKSKELNDYPKKPCGLCKYSTGQCEYYHICKPHEKE
jgi:CRISPR/Cas system-associated exonuclease Cas4 (RecB family)